ncbi:MAG: carboxypeptidase regulatory-like domain-containing protein [Candidatus Marinimicrobia bacterium]|nr:carboxypeptidase regulatory-like domain-containing protein [Candidatus Neomarinimicrobiota bacterium]MCK9559823.1 carboxypeptidase regulatory-like domain-containing protein [Candidatus Neomarinimicrobiota bacterium]
MKKVAIVLLLVVWSVTGLANPIAPQLFSELYFDSTGWKIEVMGGWASENDNRIVIISSTDSAETDTSFHYLGDFPVITSTDMETTLYINPNGDHIWIGIRSEYGWYCYNDFIFGENGVIAAPRSGESIAFGGAIEASEYEYYLDDTPTLGAYNDYENSKGTIRGIVTDSSGVPIPGVTVKYSFVNVSITISTDESGQFECECPTGKLYFTFRHNDYEFLSVPVQIWPDSTLELNIVMQPEPEYYQSYFPLQVGNIWIYDNFIHPFASRDTVEILDTTRIDGKKYFTVNDSYVRYDSLGNLVKYHNGNDVMFFPLAFPDTNTIVLDSVGTPIMVCVNRDSDLVEVPAGAFDNLLTVMWDEAIDATSFYTYSKYIGLVKTYYAWFAPQQSSLVYAKVNGTEYPTSIINPHPSQPEKYALILNNYPNPFNSSTTLKYHLPETGDVRLSVFDLSGRLVEELFSGRQSAGDYHYLWSGGNLPSGVYLISLQAGDQKVVKKCLLMK